jgi:hypothetical protein
MAEPPCPRCEADAAPSEKLTAETVARAAAQFFIAPSLCADVAVYEARLNRCGDCDALREGILCAYCGCFVRFRARPTKSYCPNPAGDRWLGIQEGRAPDEKRRQ